MCVCVCVCAHVCLCHCLCVCVCVVVCAIYKKPTDVRNCTSTYYSTLVVTRLVNIKIICVILFQSLCYLNVIHSLPIVGCFHSALLRLTSNLIKILFANYFCLPRCNRLVFLLWIQASHVYFLLRNVR